MPKIISLIQRVYICCMKIYLMGFMGSGKSTIGILLSRLMKTDFIDFDRNLEREEGKSIAEIFDTLGEEKFRALEHLHLKKILSKDNVVVSLGGGTPCFHNNMEMINQSGVSVFLETDTATLAKRLLKEKNDRPLIRGLNEKELNHFIESSLAKRMPVYTKADHTVKGENKSPENIAQTIRKLISEKSEA